IKLIIEKEKSINTNEINKIKEQQLLESCNIIFGTIASIGSKKCLNLNFDFVIVYNSTLSVELLTLITFQLSNIKSYIFVGDPQQLSPKIISSDLVEYEYSQSFFERCTKCNIVQPFLLNTQYRMHPEIFF